MPPDERDDAPGENIPLQGTHQGDTDDPVTASVRAQQPPAEADDAAPGQEESADHDAPDEDERLGTYRLSHDPSSGLHRVRLHPPSDDDGAEGGGFRELSQHASTEDLSGALEERLGGAGPRFVVLENSETGEARLDRAGALGDNWFADTRFDQATVFDNEDDAATYVEDRRSD